MHLNKIKLTRFRSCRETTIHLQPELTVLVGENNGGKSNIIDAIRLLTLPLNGRRDRYAEDEDVTRGAEQEDFILESHYSGMSDTLRGLLVTAMPDPAQDLAVFGCKYIKKPPGSVRGKFSYWSGEFDTTEPEAGSNELVRHVYLPALRDAQQALGSGSTSRLLALFRHFLPADQEEAFVGTMQRDADASQHEVLTTMNTEIGTALKELTSGAREQTAEISFTTQRIQDVARDLRFKLGDAGVDLDEISSSGLGYSNLLYMSTIIVELAKARESDLTIFLVEEPEAHLHPQLQMLVLEFLLEKARKSMTAEIAAGNPEGRIQVVVTTHSPNLTAEVSPKHLVVVRSGETGEPPQKTSKCISVANINVDESVIKKVGRYLDVTRSSLLFSGRAILVEGLAEALLLPLFARKFVYTTEAQRGAFLRFRGASLISIDGVDFKPYIELLLTSYEGSRLGQNIVVVTDGDPQLEGNRKQDLESFANNVGAGDNLNVYTNSVTFEHELFRAGNEEFLRNVFLRLHPRLGERWQTEVSNKPETERAEAFIELLKNTKTRKGDLAQEIALAIERGDTFVLPTYLRQAIEKVSEL